jgi:hexosaminidase
MAGIFPDAFMHVGGDENNGKQWNANPRIQAFMLEKGFRSNEDLQAYFSGRVAQILAKHGKRCVGWDEILHSDLPSGTVVHAWRGGDKLYEATAKGYDTILSHGYYLDLAQPASEHYLREPFQTEKELSAGQKAHVIGGEACMWAELVDENTVDSRIWPRALAVAERLWSPAEERDVDFLYARLDRMGAIDPRRAALIKELGPPQLQILIDTLSPLRGYRRHRGRNYTQDTPLNRLVDAVAPDGPGPRRANALALKADKKGLAALYKSWIKASKELLGPLKASERTVEVAVLAEDLGRLGALGLQVLDALEAGRPLDPAWAGVLERAEIPKGELEFSVIPGLRQLCEKLKKP